MTIISPALSILLLVAILGAGYFAAVWTVYVEPDEATPAVHVGQRLEGQVRSLERSRSHRLARHRSLNRLRARPRPGVDPVIAQLDVGPLVHGVRWRRCADCHQRVWETKRGKLSRHMPKPDREGEDPIAGSSFEARGPRCEGSGS